MDSTKPFVCLEGIQHGNRFFSRNSPGDGDPTKSAKGETWYRVLGYADTPEEARRILYPTQEEENAALLRYLRRTAAEMEGLSFTPSPDYIAAMIDGAQEGHETED